MDTLTEHEQGEIDRANGTGRRPIVFIHGLWLLSGSRSRAYCRCRSRR
jgi:non-heme chloroperoxidase